MLKLHLGYTGSVRTTRQSWRALLIFLCVYPFYITPGKTLHSYNIDRTASSSTASSHIYFWNTSYSLE